MNLTLKQIWERSCHGLIEVLSHYFPVGTEEKSELTLAMINK
jgi:hypothetical protein